MRSNIIVLAVFLLCALFCCRRAQARELGNSGGGRELKLLDWLFGDDDDDETVKADSSESVVKTGGSAITSSSSSVSISSSTSKDHPCGKTQSYSESTGGGFSTSTSRVYGDDCEVSSDSTALSKGDETVIASATAEAEKGEVAKAIAESIGSGNGVDVVSEAIAKAVEGGNGDAVAVAIGNTLEEPCPEETREEDCPAEVATDAVVKAFALAENEGDGLAFAEAIAVGVVSEDLKVQSVFATAISKIIKEEGCEVVKPVLSEARAVAVGDEKEKVFVEALDVDVKIAECLFDACKGDALKCCQGEKCEFEIWRSVPIEIWELGDAEKCICPSDF